MMEKGFHLKGLLMRLKKVQNIEYFIFILAIAIIIGLFSNWFQPGEEGQETGAVQEQGESPAAASGEEYSTDQEYRLKQVLSAIKGAGRVEVMITYKTGKELVPAMNTMESNTETEEKDSNGGIRKVSQTDINSQPVSMTTSEGSQPLITAEIQPEVLGVIVVAEGAEDIQVRIELQKAVQTVLGVRSNQVDIFVMEDN
jgi:stage III sporulation protein AG